MARGKPAHKPTKVSRAIVKALSGFGLKYEHIARHPEVGVGLTTLHKHYREDLDTGNSAALGKIGEGLFQKAMGGDTTALIFLAKCRLGFKEVSRIENTGADGGPIQVEESPRERIAGRLARLKIVGGTEADTA